MCTVIIVRDMKQLKSAIDYSRKFIARGMFFQSNNTVMMSKEKFNENNMTHKMDANWAVIHCRQPTQGPPENSNNNHPWTIDGKCRYVVGCQVGGVRYGYEDIEDLNLQGDCDSEVALQIIANTANPWPWIEQNMFGMLFFWAGKSATDGALYAYNPVLSQMGGKYFTYGMGFEAGEKGLYIIDFEGGSLITTKVLDTEMK
jgi:hypothetical protein